jgi:transcription initiation factor IIF auxiliary subunit
LKILFLELNSTPFAIQETGYAGFHLVRIKIILSFSMIIYLILAN